MRRSQLRDVPSWMVRLLPEPFEGFHKSDASKMFGSETTATSTSTFYTDLEEENDNGRSEDYPSSERRSVAGEDGNWRDSDPSVGTAQRQRYGDRSFHRIASYGGFPRFQPFVMSASSPAEASTSVDGSEGTTSVVQMSRGVLEYRSSSYATTKTSSNEYRANSYAVSESDSEDESEETRSSETDSVLAIDEKDETPRESEASEASEESEETRKDDRSSGKNHRGKGAQRVAEELLATEIKYVGILHLIDQVFQFRVDQENRAHPMFPPETVQHMFSNIKSIYKFHNDFLLPQLEERMKRWQSDSRIGDIMKNFAPFLKMYTEYVKNFDHAMNLINTLQHKVTRFAAIVNDIQKLEECAKLSLSHHMLSPIQRLPRYELLLKDYLRYLKEDNPDYQDTKKALELVSTAANHTNEAMKKIDKFKKLLEIQESIYDATDLVSATRELVKEGRIVKISARSGDHQERYLFLFSDMLLLCSIRLIPGPLYRLRAKFFMENMEVVEGDNLETANTFYIRDANKSVELYTEGTAEKAAWLDALFRTMQEIMRRKASLKSLKSVIGGGADDDDETALVKADDVTRCMACQAIFSVMKRKHNCRACGIVVCGKCSNQKLLFEDNKNMRVCRLCHAALTQPLAKSPSGPVPSLLQVSASDPCVLSGFLYLKTQASKPWTRRWFALHADFVLYTFKSNNERLALTATPMPGFALTEGHRLPEDDPLNSRDRKGTFKIHHSRKYYYLQAHSQEETDTWMRTLELATRAELPRKERKTEEKGHENVDPQKAQSIAHVD